MFRIRNKEDYESSYQESVSDPVNFWAKIAENFVWKRHWDTVLDWNFKDPKVEWFQGAQLNITENCLDRHLVHHPDRAAIIWEPNDPNESSRTLTYKQLHEEVCRFSIILRKHGVKKGDRICIYMPMVPELAVAVLACARVGAIHSVVFGGFSAQSIADRINDSECCMVITADGCFRGTKELKLKPIIDDALTQCPSVKSVIVLNRAGFSVSMIDKRDFWWHEELREFDDHLPKFDAECMEAEDPLFILYTSGSTGKPKGVVHTCGGYMVYAGYTFANVFQYQEQEIYFCTADIGWITGHSYVLYGPLSQGATSLMFEGIPTFPDAGRFWDIIQKHKVNIFYTAPTAIRSLMQCGLDFIKDKDLSSLRVLGSVGEPINEEAWHWFHDHIGNGKCPIVDTWWQTETGGIMISPLAGITELKPAHATLPLPGIQPVLLDDQGEILQGNGVSGNLCIRFPWPGMIRTTYNDHERCRQNYFATYPGYYFTGDGCLRDHQGYYRITGRVDDVINVSGHRIGTAEVENAINEHPNVIESAVVAYPHEIKGQGIYAYVICEQGGMAKEGLMQEISAQVTKLIGALARPDKIQIVSALPKTRSGKIMRRILRKIAEGEVQNFGDTSTLLDPTVVEEIRKGRV